MSLLNANGTEIKSEVKVTDAERLAFIYLEDNKSYVPKVSYTETIGEIELWVAGYVAAAESLKAMVYDQIQRQNKSIKQLTEKLEKAEAHADRVTRELRKHIVKPV